MGPVICRAAHVIESQTQKVLPCSAAFFWPPLRFEALPPATVSSLSQNQILIIYIRPSPTTAHPDRRTKCLANSIKSLPALSTPPLVALAARAVAMWSASTWVASCTTTAATARPEFPLRRARLFVAKSVVRAFCTRSVRSGRFWDGD